MSYLSQLAARTLNQLPSVQPRLPARFESARREMQPERTAPLEYATFTPSAPAISAAVAASTPEPITREILPRSAADSPAPPAAAPPHPSLDAGPMHTTLVYQPEPRAEEKSRQTVPPPPAAPIERNTGTIIERDAPTLSTNTTIEQPTLIERDAPTLSTNTTIEQLTLIEHRALVEHQRLRMPIPIPTPEARAPRVAPQVTPYVPPAPPYAPPPEPGPVIQVSIGRIEVRAMPPPASSAQPQPAAKPGLSLDDYLRGGRS